MAPESTPRPGLIWFLRLAAVATALAIPCWLLAPFFRAGLLRAVNGVLGVVVGPAVQLEALEMDTPFDLGLFASLCLATRQAPASRRRFALLVGIPIMLVLEVVVVVSGVLLMIFLPQWGAAVESAERLGSYVMRTVQWVNAPLLWLALLGAWISVEGGGAANPFVGRTRAEPRSDRKRRAPA
jgi:hypothetical protein